MKKISFMTEDNIKLDGLLYEPKILTKEVIISVHGMNSNCFKRREDLLSGEIIRNNISYFCFNNRGHDLVVYIDKYIDGKRKKVISGTAYEDILDSYYDILGAIKAMIDIGYEKIHLQGHSYGCTKIVYTYNRLIDENNTNILNKISSIILLSLVDVIGLQKHSLGDKYDQLLEYANEMEKENKLYELMPENSFIHAISVKTYLRQFKYNESIDFLRYEDNNYDFEKLNNIQVPLFIRWGNDREMVTQDVSELAKSIDYRINNPHRDIGYIDGANHSYDGNEIIVANEILRFIKH